MDRERIERIVRSAARRPGPREEPHVTANDTIVTGAAGDDVARKRRGEEVVVVDTGVANIASLVAAFLRQGRGVRLTLEPEEVVSAERVVLPGVGAFGAGMARLREGGMVEALAERLAADRPVLAVCLGMQLLGSESEESPGVEGLGLLPLVARRFPASVRVPQFGWNRVEPSDGARLLEPGYAYFANSFRIDACPPGATVAWSDHGGPFVAAFERGRLLACQFHPELSGAWGQDLLGRWLELET